MTARSAPGETIAAVATAGGSIGIVRVSGHRAAEIAHRLTGRQPKPRTALLCTFRDAQNEPIDHGLVIWFPAPASYTGEDVVEFQGHGGAITPQRILERVLALGARRAHAGEFTERAFLNGKLDLAQAEAVADLIASTSERAARAALHSLQGAFSRQVNALVESTTALRVLVEAHIDFAEEELDHDWVDHLGRSLDVLLADHAALLARAGQGRCLTEGIHVVLAGPPNAGKSSLLNALSQQDSAIVTEHPGTTRDVLREQVRIEGVPVVVMDTAGLRDSADPVEAEGVRRTRAQMRRVEQVLLVIDLASTTAEETAALLAAACAEVPEARITLVGNKTDLLATDAVDAWLAEPGPPRLALSARTGNGLEALGRHLVARALGEGDGEGLFSARARHLSALEDSRARLTGCRDALTQGADLELLAEELRLSQVALGGITGEVTSDDLLGEIFSSFCIGK